MVENGEPDRGRLDERRRDCGLQAPAFDGVPQRTPEQLGANPALHQVILRAVPDSLKTDRFVVQPGHHQHGDLGLGENRRQSVEAVTIGQVQIEQDRIERLGTQTLQGIRQPIGPLGADVSSLAHSLLDEAGVAGVVLNQKDPESVRRLSGLLARPRRNRRDVAHGRGSWTTASQKSSRDRIAAMNSSISIGFVT